MAIVSRIAVFVFFMFVCDADAELGFMARARAIKRISFNYHHWTSEKKRGDVTSTEKHYGVTVSVSVWLLGLKLAEPA